MQVMRPLGDSQNFFLYKGIDLIKSFHSGETYPVTALKIDLFLFYY